MAGPQRTKRTPLRHRKKHSARHAAWAAAAGPAPAPVRKPSTPERPPRVVDVVRSGPAPAFGQCDVVYKDAHILLVDKGPGLLTVPPDSGDPPTVLGFMKRRLKGAHGQVFAVHRLDRDTSGVLVLARTQRALDVLVRELAARQFHRVYLAIVEGVPPPCGTLRGHLATRGKDLRMRNVAEGEGQLAVTHFRVVEQAPTHALVAFKLETGRRNQIRTQMAALGHALLGEKQYADAESMLLSRQALHSHRLHLTHPTTRDRVEALSPLPEDMMRAWQKLGGKHGRVLAPQFEVPGPNAPVLEVMEGRDESADRPAPPRPARVGRPVQRKPRRR